MTYLPPDPADAKRLAALRFAYANGVHANSSVRFLLRLLDASTAPPPASAIGQPQGRCDFTQTERFTYPACRCDTYEGNLGPCKTYEQGASGRCVYCDHDLACHVGLILGRPPFPPLLELIAAALERDNQ